MNALTRAPSALQPVIVCGTGDARFWPLTGRDRPKAFAPLLGERSLFERLIASLAAAGATRPPLVVVPERHRFLAAEQLRATGVTAAALIPTEPERGMAAAAALAAWFAAHTAPETILLVATPDGAFEDIRPLRQALPRMAKAAERGWIVSLSVPTTRPESEIVHVKLGDPLPGLPGCRRLIRPVEAADPTTARLLHLAPDHGWSCGLHVLRADVLLTELEARHPETFRATRAAMDQAAADPDFLRPERRAFARAATLGFEAALLPGSERGAAYPADPGWRDLTGWNELHAASGPDERGNVVAGDAAADGASDCYIRSDGPRLVALDLDGIVLVATRDAVFAAPRDRAHRIATLAEPPATPPRPRVTKRSGPGNLFQPPDPRKAAMAADPAEGDGDAPHAPPIATT